MLRTIVAVVEIKDRRDGYIAEALGKEGLAVTEPGKENERGDAEIIYVKSILSEVTAEEATGFKSGTVLFSRGISESVKAIVDAKSIRHVDILKDETFIVKNAYLTAEGALAYIILNTDSTIRQMPILLLGYGRVGKSVNKLLKDNYSFVTVATDDRSEFALATIFSDAAYDLVDFKAHVGEFAVIINTIPKLILEGDTLKDVRKDAFILDLASKPGGVDFEAAEALGLNVMHALGVPGKVAPKTAGGYIKDVIIKNL
jgi:hypothetical protein